MSVMDRARACGPAASAAWAETPGYLATGRGASAGRVPRSPVRRRSASWSERGSRSACHLIEGFFQTVRKIETQVAPARGARRARHARGRASPTSSTTRRRRRRARSTRCRTPARRCSSSLVRLAERSLTAEQFVAIWTGCDGDRRVAEAPRRPVGARRSRGRAPRLARRARRRRRAGASRRRSPRPASTSRGANAPRDVLDARHARARARLGRERRSRPPPLLVRGQGVDLADLEPRRGGEVVLAARPRVAAADRRHRGHRQHARDARATSSRDGVTVVRDYATDLPPIEAIPGELNQVWTNLIDNAIDAMDGTRHAPRVDARPTATTSSSRSPTPGPGCPPEVQAARLRAVLHDQGRRQGHRAGPRHLAPHRRRPPRRRDRDRVRSQARP